MLRALLCAWLAGAPLASQVLELHSEFLRVDPQGEVLPSDATPQPREILSPGVVRNGYASFHIVIRAERLNYFLFVGTNPPGVLRTSLYKEEFVKVGDAWIPDTLKAARYPDFGVIPDPEAALPGQKARAYLLDVFVPPETPPGKVRLEVQLKTGGWTIWPLEVRVLPAIVPVLRASFPKPLPAIERPSDEAVAGLLLSYLESNGRKLGERAVPPELATPRNVREVIRRNAEQDLTLAGGLNPATLVPLLKQKVAENRGGSEWYLRVRDLIYRLSSGEAAGAH